MKNEEEFPALKLLAGEECIQLKGLWREAFPEDSDAFTAYYFSRKAPRNRGLALEGRDGIRAMLFLTPETLLMRGVPVRSAYVVGVATKEEYRHRGYMAALLNNALRLLFQEKAPFLFLMPASADIYRPFGFRYIYDRPVWDADSLLTDRLSALTGADAERMAAFAQKLLSEEKDVYIARDAAYYKLLLQETKAQNGAVFGYLPKGADGELEGLCVYANDGEAFIQEALARPEAEARFVKRTQRRSPVIMARIVHLPAMLSLLRSARPEQFMLEVTDPLISENNGCFLCRTDSLGCRVSRCGTESGKSAGMCVRRVDVSGLIGLIFGYSAARGEPWERLEPLSRVWINEIV